MHLSEAIRKLMRDNNTTYIGLAKKAGYKSGGSLGTMLSRGDVKSSTLLKICNALDYDVIIKPRYGENKAERTIVLTPAEERAE